MPLSAEQSATRVQVRVSAVSEMLWLEYRLGVSGIPDLPGLRRLSEAASRLARELAEMWGEENFHHMPEGWILALRTGTLLGDQVGPFLDRLEEAARLGDEQLDLASETDGDRRATLARLGRLRREPELVRRYRRLHQEMWELASEEWETAGRAAATAAARTWSQRLAAGGSLEDLLQRSCPVHSPQMLGLRDQVVVSPIHVMKHGGGFAIDAGDFVHLGTSASGDTLAAERREAGRVAGRLKVLSDPTRLALLRQLVHLPTSVTELAQSFGLAQPTVSAHVRLLKDAGLLDSSRDGSRVLYSAPRERVSQLLTEAGDALFQ